MADKETTDGTDVDSVIDDLGGHGSALVADVLDEPARVMDHAIAPLDRGMRVAATAVTASTPPRDNLTVHKVVSAAGPGDVIVVDANGFQEAGIWGELLTVAAIDRGVEGVIVDGGVRDVKEITELGFPCFSRAISPNGSTKVHAGPINEPIACGGVVIDPGDIVVADADGVVAIPPDRDEAVRHDCLAKSETEAAYRETADVYQEHAARYDELRGEN